MVLMEALGHVALDGTKVKANASKHKAMSYQRMKEKAAAVGVVCGATLARWDKLPRVRAKDIVAAGPGSG